MSEKYNLCEWNQSGVTIVFEGTKKQCEDEIVRLEQALNPKLYVIFQKYPSPDSRDAEAFIPPEQRDAWRERMKQLENLDEWNS